MADRRYKNGTFQHNPAYAPIMKSPTDYGWQQIGENDRGYVIFELGQAKMRSTTLDEQERSGHGWLVFTGDSAYGFSGDLGWITEEVRGMLG